MKGNKQQKVQKLALAISAFSLAAVLTAFFSMTFSWFAFNRSARVIYEEAEAVANLRVAYAIYVDDSPTPLEGSEILFADLIPGQQPRKIKLVAENIGEETTKLNLSFLAPLSNEEVPFIDSAGIYGPANYYYYLGSQIAVKSVDVKIDNVPVVTNNGAGSFLVPTNSVGVSKGQVNGVDSEITTFSDLSLASGVTVAVGEVAIIEMTFIFVDNGTNQNVYMDAWNSGGVSKRNIKLKLGVNA